MTSSLDDHVFFAGEHTSENYGFVHSAWESGLEVVDEVLVALWNRSSTTNSTTAADSVTTNFAFGLSVSSAFALLPLHAFLSYMF